MRETGTGLLEGDLREGENRRGEGERDNGRFGLSKR